MLAGGPLGIMQACLDVVLPYMRERKQFGSPIGQFQLMQAKIAEMYVGLNSARSYVYAVARACDTGHAAQADAALRDAKLYDIGAGPNEIRRYLIGREIIGL
jgi:isovaleryl-CoA dehydrogenase